MAKIQELLADKNDVINIKHITERNPWIKEERQKCILSPDSDGLLCGLFLSHYLNWEIVGFYDGKVALIKDGLSFYDEDVCFIDIEVYREGVKSMGHHMLSLYNNTLPNDWNKRFTQCIQPNLMRGYDKHNFRLKYPLATIHLLITILEKYIDIEVRDTAIFPLLFTDGTFNVMFKYPENVMNWWKYLNVQNNSKLLHKVFMSDDFSVYKLMLQMDNFFRRRDKISIKGERGDRLKISNTDSSAYNLCEDKNNLFRINSDAVRRLEQFFEILSKDTGWVYKKNKWNYKGLKKLQFTKSDFKSKKWNVNKTNWNQMLELNPVSWAMTSGDNIEFTLEHPDKLF